MAQEAIESNKVKKNITAQDTILDKVIKATKQTTRSQTEDLLRSLTQHALEGAVTWDKNLTGTIKQSIKKIDEKISQQLAKIMHHEKFSKLEGSWRGLNHLVMNTETSTSLRIKVMYLSKRELFKDLDKAVEFDQSQLFKKVYENEFGMPGGEPYSLLVGDYEFTGHPEDIDTLAKVSNVAAAAFTPFIASAGPSIMGFDDWRELAKPRDLAKIFDNVEYAKWQSFRESEDARFVTLTLPRTLARLPYGEDTKPVDEFDYEEISEQRNGKAAQQDHKEYCWMNSAYALGTQITAAFSKYNWCTAIRGVENGGKVENLPLHVFYSTDGDLDSQCPTELGITDRREAELSNLGFLPLCHFKNTDYSVFFGAQSVQKPKKYDIPTATANAMISARLPYILATSRFAHYLKVLARDKIGSFMEAADCEEWLNRWINNYVNANESSGAEIKAKFPLREAKIKVQEIPGKPGSYNAVAWLRPWLQLEELTTSLRMVARIPKMAE